MRCSNCWLSGVLLLSGCVAGLAVFCGGACGAEKPQEKAPKIVTEFPKPIHGFHGRLMGTISAINKSGIVLSDIVAVEKEHPPEQPGDLPYTKAVKKDAPEAWLLGKNVQLLCKDDEYKKNYRVGQVIRGVVEWSEKQKGLVILGAQWTGGGQSAPGAPPAPGGSAQKE